MHIRPVSRIHPQQAYNIEQILDIILQAINVVERLAGLFGVNVTEFLGKFIQPT